MGTTDANDVNFIVNNLNKMTIRNTGNVGIGTTTPESLFTVNGTSAKILINDTFDDGVSTFEIRNDGTTIFNILEDGIVNVNKISQSGAESISRFSVSDDPVNFLQIANGSIAVEKYTPKIYAYAANTAETSLTIEANCGNNDSVSNGPVMVFNSLRGLNETVGGRLLFDFRNNNASKMVISADGNVGIGVTDPTYKLDVAGDVRCTGNISLWSDIRFKEKIQPISSQIDKLEKLNPVTFYWKTEEYKDMGFANYKQIGLIAQEVENIYPELINTDSNGYKAIEYSKFTPIIIEAIKELKSQKDIEIEQLKIKNEELMRQNESLEIRLKLIEEKLGMR